MKNSDLEIAPNDRSRARRLLLLCATTGYEARAFVEAAGKLGLSVVFGTDRCHVLEDPWGDGALALRFENPDLSAAQIVDYARAHPLDAIIALGDRPTPTAARACQALKLPYHPKQAVDTCRDKYLCRARLRAAGLNVPDFVRYPLDSDPRGILGSVAAAPALRSPLNGKPPAVGLPCVLKPLALSASRGVIRADNPEQFLSAFDRIRALLRRPEVQVMREDTSNFIQIEAYVEGEEIAVEGLMDRGELKTLAIFDKPDPLVGPFFEETIYVTPSRLKAETQAQVIETLERATRALELYHGPLHAELRINAKGIWVLEIAARPIGGLCSRALRFRSPSIGESISLEELIIRLALETDIQAILREPAASGVMMIPIAEGGIFQGTEGVEVALKTPGVEDIVITAKPAQKLEPLPEGTSYLGFIFAHGPSPQRVEHALRSAHQKLRFVISPALSVI